MEKTQDYLGMAMIFNIIEFIKLELPIILKNRLDSEISVSEVDVSVSIPDGPLVTESSFKEWKSEFSTEIAEKLLKHQVVSRALMDFAVIHNLIQKVDRITGRQLFEKNINLAIADLDMLDDATDVAVDLSLFEGIEQVNDEFQEIVID